MMISPSLDMTVGRCGVWQAGVAVLVVLAAATTLTWGFAAPASAPVAQAAGLLLAALCIVAAVPAAFRVGAVRLRWDGKNWSVAPAGSDDAPTPIEPPTVALDLGAWMLLRLQRVGASRRLGRSWLPLQRRGHEVHWHALRCAVYSPRPAPGGPVAAEP